MPYQFNSDLPLPVRSHLPDDAQDIYRAAFNSAFETYSGDPRQEEIAHRVAWAGGQAPLCEAGRGLGTPLSPDPVIAVIDEPTLADKVAFLSQPDAYGKIARAAFRRETHMSWIFFADDRVFKLKKPVHFAYLDFSTLARRETACRAELKLNRHWQTASTWMSCRWYGRSAALLLGDAELRWIGSWSCVVLTRFRRWNTGFSIIVSALRLPHFTGMRLPFTPQPTSISPNGIAIFPTTGGCFSILS